MLTRTLITALLVTVGAGTQHAAAKEAPPPKAEHPGDAALSQDEQGKWRYRSFPGLATLYVYDKDGPEKSNCNDGCESAWPPLRVSASESTRRVGNWSVITRRDGQRQWAYKGKPVYTRFHDIRGDTEDIARAGFRELEP